MDLVMLILVIALIGLLVWAITTQIPMPPMWARALQVFALIVIVLYIISRFLHLPNVLPH